MVPLEFETTPAASPRSLTSLSAGSASGSATLKSPAGALYERRRTVDPLPGLVHDLDAAERRLEALCEPELDVRRGRPDGGAHARLGAIEERVRPHPGRPHEEGDQEEEQRRVASEHQLPNSGRPSVSGKRSSR